MCDYPPSSVRTICPLNYLPSSPPPDFLPALLLCPWCGPSPDQRAEFVPLSRPPFSPSFFSTPSRPVLFYPNPAFHQRWKPWYPTPHLPPLSLPRSRLQLLPPTPSTRGITRLAYEPRNPIALPSHPDDLPVQSPFAPSPPDLNGT